MQQQIIDENTVFEHTRSAIVKALGVEEEAVLPDSFLTEDLSAESLDFLDINYTLEQAFGLKMARYSVLDHIEEIFGEGTAVDDNGLLTDEAVEVLRMRFDHGNPRLRSGMDMEEVLSLVTVRSIVEGVMNILDTLPQQCSRCGAAEWDSGDGTHITCGSCNEHAEFSNGDDLTVAWLKKPQDENAIFPPQ